MDYRQSGGQDTKNPFFVVPGAGNKAKNSEEVRPEIEVVYTRESENPDHNIEGIGNSAIESIKDPSEDITPKLGQVINAEMPPGMSKHLKRDKDSVKAAINLTVDEAKIKITERGGLNHSGERALETTIKELGNGKISPADFYSKIRGEGESLTHQVLKNSFGREIGEGEKAA